MSARLPLSLSLRPGRPAWALGAALAMGLISVLPAQADEERLQPAPRVVVVSVGEGAPLVNLVAGGRAAVARHGALDSIDLAAMLSGGEGGNLDRHTGLEMLQRGQQAFDELDLDAAEPLLEQAVTVLAGTGELSAAASAAAGLARAAAARRDTKGRAKVVATAEEWYALAFRLDPMLSINGEELPPSVRSAMDAGRAEAAKAPGQGPTGTLNLTVSEPSATVRVNRTHLGVAPVSDAPIPAGLAVLVIESDGFMRLEEIVRVMPDKSATRSMKLADAGKGSVFRELRAGLAEQFGRNDVVPAMRELRSLTVADQAVLITRTDEKVLADLFDYKIGRQVRRVAAPAADDYERGEALVAALYRGLDPRAPGLVAPPEEEADASAGLPAWKQWWFWPAVVAGTAAAVAIPILLLREEGPEGLKRTSGEGAVLLRF